MKQINLKQLRDLTQKAQKYSKRATTKALPTIAVVILTAGISFLVWNTFRQQAQLTAFDQKVQQVKDVEKRLTLEKDRLTLENAINATRAQVIGGVLVFFTAFTAWRNLKIAEDKQVTDRFSKAVEQLGHADRHVRLGAIYSLERIANDSDRDYWPVMEILTAYVRERSAWTKEKAEACEAQENPEIPPLAIDIQAILTVLGRRKHSLGDGEEYPLDLRTTDLRRADLRGAKKMQGVWLSESHLKWANLNKANLKGANMLKANLEGAYLIETNLEGADMSDTNLQQSYLMATNLEGADMSSSNLKGANLAAANLKGTILRKAKNLTPIQLVYAKTDQNTIYPDDLEPLQPHPLQRQDPIQS